jgi:hypothetical protein
MISLGRYVYGFTERAFRPPAELRGLRKAPVRSVVHGEVAAVVSLHPVQPLMPLRIHLEPHHRVVRQISSDVTLLPAAFGHISDSEPALVDVLRSNHDEIREALERLQHKCEMGLKLSWNVPNIFEFFVQRDAELRTLCDGVFGRRAPAIADKLQVGEVFAAKLARERERLSALLLRAMERVSCEVVSTPPRDEKTVCSAALLIERSLAPEFAGSLRSAAALFDSSFALESSGPWPVYSFARLRLQGRRPEAAA